MPLGDRGPARIHGEMKKNHLKTNLKQISDTANLPLGDREPARLNGERKKTNLKPNNKQQTKHTTES